MSIYRTILEEELELGGVISDESDNAPEIQEIEDVIEDQDANGDEQDAAQAAAFGPSDGVDDIMDESFMAIAEGQMEFNKLMQAVGIYEVNEAAAGREVIYESVDIKGYLTKAKDWVVNFFKKVWQVLQRYAHNIASVFHTNKGFASKYASQIKSGYEAYKKADNNKLKMFTYKNLDAVLKTDKWTNCTKYLKNYLDVASDWDANHSNAKNLKDADSVDAVVRGYRKHICGKECDAGDFRDELLKYIRGGEDKEEGLMPPDDVIAALKSSDAVSAAKKAIDKAKDEYKKAINKLNDLQKKFAGKTSEEGKKGKDATKNMNTCVRVSTMLQQCLAATQVARAAILSSANSRMSQARAYGQAYVAAYNKGQYKGFQKESAEYGFLSNLDLV